MTESKGFFPGRSRIYVVAFIFALTFLVYFGITDNGLHCDDYWLVRDNPLSQITATFHEGWGFRPLVWIEFLILYELTGGHSFWYYIVNLTTISLLVLVIIFLTAYLLKSEILGIFCGLFFLLHFNNTEMFFWIAGNTATLGILLTLSSFYGYLVKRRGWSLFLFVVSLGVYELGIFVPLMIALYVLLDDVFGTPGSRPKGLTSFVRPIKAAVPYLTILGGYALLIKILFNLDFFGLALTAETYPVSVYQTQFMRYFYYLFQGFLIKDFILSALLFVGLLVLSVLFMRKKKEYRVTLLFLGSCLFLFFIPFLAREGYSYRHGSFGLTMLIPLFVLVAYLAIKEVMAKLSGPLRFLSGGARAAEVVLGLILILIMAGNLAVIDGIEKEWQSAGRQNESMLDTFVSDYPVPPAGKIVFTNIPAYKDRALAFITFFDLALSDRYRTRGLDKSPEEIIFTPESPETVDILKEHPDTAMIFRWSQKSFQVVEDFRRPAAFDFFAALFSLRPKSPGRMMTVVKKQAPTPKKSAPPN